MAADYQTTSVNYGICNKAVTVVWGIIWGAVFFHESITVGKVIGAALVIVGVVIYARADEGEVNE